MKIHSIVTLSCFIATFSIAFAATGIPSFGLQTALQFRNRLQDSDFTINFEKGTLSETPEFTNRGANLANFPVLGAQDVQTQLGVVSVRAGKAFLRHSHPRSSEILYILKGRFLVEIVFEGVNPRVVKTHVRAGEATVFPQGLVHQVTCISKRDCQYVTVFTSADPGFVNAPAPAKSA